MLEPPDERVPSGSYRVGRGDVRVTISLQGQSASDKATAARFNDWKGVDSPESKVQSIPGRDAAWLRGFPKP